MIDADMLILKDDDLVIDDFEVIDNFVKAIFLKVFDRS